jgi:PadR family transcriptional regulator PadR
MRRMTSEVLDRTALYLRGALDLCLLAVIDGEPAYGYEMTQRLRAHGLTVAEGSIYPALGRLQRDALVEPFAMDGTGGPPRKYYRLTRTGRTALHRWAGEWRALTLAIGSVLEGDRA